MDDIRARRQALGWSRRDLADRSGVDVRVLQLIELGQYGHQEMIDKVLAALDAAERGPFH